MIFYLIERNGHMHVEKESERGCLNARRLEIESSMSGGFWPICCYTATIDRDDNEDSEVPRECLDVVLRVYCNKMPVIPCLRVYPMYHLSNLWLSTPSSQILFTELFFFRRTQRSEALTEHSMSSRQMSSEHMEAGWTKTWEIECHDSVQDEAIKLGVWVTERLLQTTKRTRKGI